MSRTVPFGFGGSLFVDYLIAPELGRLVGGNLFHSFSQFSIGTGETATFAGPPAIENVISRVTGGVPSAIDGTLRSTIPQADLYLVNPSGVMFGPDSSLDVKGSLHVTTADNLRFPSGELFEARVEGAVPMMAIPPPSAFGFLGDPAPISARGGSTLLSVPPGEALSLIGGDIEISDARLAAPGGRLTLVSARSPGEVARGPEGVDVSSFTRLGEVHVTASRDAPLFHGGILDVSSEAGGTVTILGERVSVDGRSSINANTTGSTEGSTDGAPVGVRIVADELTIADNVFIDSFSGDPFRPSLLTANGGDVILKVRNLTMRGGSVRVHNFGSGRAGTIRIEADEALIGGRLEGFASTGDAGDIEIDARRLTIQGELPTTGLSVASTNPRDAGSIRITADQVLIDSATVDASTTLGGLPPSPDRANGRAGEISFDVGELTLRSSEITAATGAISPGGSIRIVARSLIAEGTTITAAPTPSARGGDIVIDAGTLRLEGTAGVVTGNSGTVRVSAEEATLRNGATIASGRGNVVVDADKLDVFAARILTGRPAGFTGVERPEPPGSIQITAGEVVVGGFVGDLGDLDPRRGIIGSLQGGLTGGDVTLTTECLTVGLGGQIASETFAGSAAEAQVPGGTVSIRAGDAIVDRGGRIKGAVIKDTIGASPAPGGVILLDVDRLEVRGLVDSGTQGDGAGGSIQIEGSRLVVSDGGKISATSGCRLGSTPQCSGGVFGGVGGGRAGDVLIDVDELLMNNSTSGGSASPRACSCPRAGSRARPWAAVTAAAFKSSPATC